MIRSSDIRWPLAAANFTAGLTSVIDQIANIQWRDEPDRLTKAWYAHLRRKRKETAVRRCLSKGE